ncbi:MAG TPA: cupin domain-containing protein [Alphaproteobacteria bacterium]|jgi:quercetin dioxygenase-like cupin family protein|nr:cupin domain-containing protein [Alphaproteobacteria bacterium]HJM52201.1 cupin domain-containing protein [Alphaproteobacteria bacterium]
MSESKPGYEVLKVADLAEFSLDKRVRKRLFLSDCIVSEAVFYEPGQSTVEHHHPRQDEIFLVLEGRGTITFGSQEVRVEPTSMLFVPANLKHGVKVDDDSRLVLLFFKGPGRPGKD